jgi:hypothetical protein
MMEVRHKAKGIFALVMRSDADQVVIHCAQQALVRALTDYSTGRLQPVNILDSFEPQAFTTMGFRRRSAPYAKRQIAANGSLAPYMSPRRVNLQKLVLAALKPSAPGAVAALVDLQKQLGRPRLRDIITLPGTGWNLRSTGGRRIHATLTLPAARRLNQPAGGVYGRELADLSRGGRAKAIMARAEVYFVGFLDDLINRSVAA